ncbi:MAG: PAN domain-containing protein, partial [Rhodobacterales bacterium]|nr:PAN domain-containing protein [Rhodobacterales bacterium]
MMLSAVLVLLLAGPAGAQSDPRSAYDQTPNAGIPGYNREILNGQSLDACLAACLDRDWCESVDFQRANGSCFLQPISERSSGKSLLKRNYPGHPYDHWARNHGTPTPAPAHRIVAAAPPDPVPAPPSSAPEMASGGCSWSTDFGPLDLPAHLPDDVRLGYGDEGGFILGQVFDRRVVGIWVQPRSDRMCDNARAGSRHWGQIHFDIDRPGGRLTGLWGMCDDPPNRPWRGTGTGCEAAAPPPPPRPKA